MIMSLYKYCILLLLLLLNVSSLFLGGSPFQPASALPSALPVPVVIQDAPSDTRARPVAAHTCQPSVQPNAKLPPYPNPRLPTPVRTAPLLALLNQSNYDSTATAALITGLSEGFHIPFEGDLHHRPVPCNHPSLLLHPSIARDMIRDETRLGRIAGPFSAPPLIDYVVSPLGLIPKKDPGKCCIIHDSSFQKRASANSGIPQDICSVSYEYFDFFVSLLTTLGQGCFIAKADVESAFRIVPIHPTDYHLLGFAFDDQYYYDMCLPTGCSISCNIFEQFSCALQWILQHKYRVTPMSHILDDFIFLSPSEQVCQHYLQQFFSLAELLSIPVNHKKTVMPSTRVIIHGIEVDTVLMQARLPQDKREAAITLVRAYRRRRKVTLRELQSVIRTLAFACKVVIMGRPFLRRLINLTIGITMPHFHIRLRQEARLDLAAWALFLEHYNGTSLLLNDLWTSSEKLELFTDASGFGYAGLLDGHWSQGLWPHSWMDYNIAIKELFTIVLALRIWPSILADRRLLVLSDNEAVVHIINNQTSKDKKLL